ncbi:putative ATP-binding protein involved in virulence [Nocardioides zeae]|uniref:ATP-binding protein involved in virulence n=1 Tax=Nocardioides zeae TaxID=1457234 RepID=A0ACC6IL79_9ACTN|nr:AAA family ATPase [Nocardioides zeae]MDR6174052.1 putative ATP-binding protein involved in virulence [Nocardioides zeae]MDR6211393.1 putative ATP-binding protein involved in virulence [Nocardioides zeae]
MTEPNAEINKVDATPPPRLTHVKVTDLLDSFTHEINFPAAWPFTIIHGPNGVGKTRFLELIEAAMNLRQTQIMATPFSRLDLKFDDGTTFSFAKSTQIVKPDVTDDLEVDKTPETSCSVVLARPDGLPVSFKFGGNLLSKEFARWIHLNTTWQPIEGTPMWRDTTDGETITRTELYDRLRRSFERERQVRAAGRPIRRRRAAAPEEMQRFVRKVAAHLIETQRLLITQDSSPRDPWEARDERSYTRTVTQHSDHLRDQLAETVREHSRLSQQLDRTFPRRIIEEQGSGDVSEAEIRAIYEEQNELRARLARYSLIDAQDEVELPDDRLDQLSIRALRTYLGDSEQKLAVFNQLLQKVELFTEIMNSRLVRKNVSVNVSSGISVKSEPLGLEIPAESLSSGEQHELVLFYDLLFQTKPGSIVMIDEPEISLHVAWQTPFLADISRVALLSDLRFIVATHSPQIIDKWWGRTNELRVEA